jgi:hypothetical protein
MSRRGSGRLVAAILVTGLVALSACSGNDGAAPDASTTTVAPITTTTTLPPSTTTTLTAQPARKVLVVGDSTMVDASPAITAMFEATGAKVEMDAGPGFGFTTLGMSGRDSPFRTDYPRLLRETHPDLVVIMLGAWDLAYMQEHGVLGYAKVVEEAANILVSDGAKVLWLAMPPGDDGPVRLQNYSFETVAAERPGQIFFVQYEGVLRGPLGNYPVSYAAADGSTVHLRKPDGFHFCPDGAERLATEVNRLAVAHGLTVPAAPGWQSGAWRSSVYYQNPVCWD